MIVLSLFSILCIEMVLVFESNLAVGDQSRLLNTRNFHLGSDFFVTFSLRLRQVIKVFRMF